MATLRPNEIADTLAEADSSLGRLIEIVGPPPARRAMPVARRFERLATAILHQQLAGAAAATITARATDVLGGELSSSAILGLDDATLRSCGVSRAKAAALRDLARRVDGGELDLAALSRCDDAEVIARLVEVRGIGRWTAEMFLMGPLGRPDVWPVGDLGVRSGWALLRRSVLEPPRSLEVVADHLRPWRSSVAWYCWQAVDVARSNGGSLPR